MFKAMIVQLKREEQGGIDHHPPIEADDLKKIYSTLKTTDPTSIQQKVFIDIMLYFGRRGRENLRNLKVDYLGSLPFHWESMLFVRCLCSFFYVLSVVVFLCVSQVCILSLDVGFK
jgi:hypothetical protein